MPSQVVAPICPYCQKDAVLRSKAFYYDGTRDGMVWACTTCKAWVDVYPESTIYKPAGRLAKERLQGMRIKAYHLFDRLWRTAAERNGWSDNRARNACYRWLAEQIQASVQPLDREIEELKTQRLPLAADFNRASERLKEHDAFIERKEKARCMLLGDSRSPQCNISAFDEAATQVVIDICSAVGVKKDVAA